MQCERANCSHFVLHVLAGLALVFSLWIVATTLQGVIETYTALPYWDAWEEVTSSQHLAQFFGQQNEHRISSSRIVFIADKLWFNGSNKLNLTAILLIQACHVGLLVYLLSRARRLDRVEWVAASAFVLTMLFWLQQSESLAWGFNVHFVGVYALATAAFAVLALNTGRYALIFAVFLAGVAAFTMANGVLVPILLVSLAIWLRRTWAEIAILSVCGALIIALFFNGYRTGAHEPEHGPTLVLAEHAVRYTLAYLGGPFAVGLKTIVERLGGGSWRGDVVTSIWLGAIVACLFAGSGLYLLLRRSAARPAQLALFHVMTFVLATALMTAWGRMQFGIEQALSSRYGTPALIFWTATALLLWSFPSGDPRPVRGAVLTAIAAIGLFVACTQLPLVAAMRIGALQRQEAETAILANVDDQDVLLRVYPVPGHLHDQVKVLKSEHLSIFAKPWAGWLGTPISSHVRLAPAKRCAGYLDEITPVSSSEPAAASGKPIPGELSGWRARGWAWDWKRPSIPPIILLVQGDGTIVGYGLPGYPRRDVVRAVHHAAAGDSGWRGHFYVDEPTSVTAYALLEGGHAVCPLGSPKQADMPTTDNRTGG